MLVKSLLSLESSAPPGLRAAMDAAVCHATSCVCVCRTEQPAGLHGDRGSPSPLSARRFDGAARGAEARLSISQQGLRTPFPRLPVDSGIPGWVGRGPSLQVQTHTTITPSQTASQAGLPSLQPSEVSGAGTLCRNLSGERSIGSSRLISVYIFNTQ